MTSIEDAEVQFSSPAEVRESAHHADAANGNNEVAAEAILALSDALSGQNGYEKILLRAAAGAGKSVQLRRMVVDALAHPACVRVAVTAFMNRQIWPLARQLGEELGASQVCLLSGKAAYGEVPEAVRCAATVVTSTTDIPGDCRVVLATASRFGAPSEYGRQLSHPGTAGNEETPYDVLFVDEAWQMALHLFAGVQRYAPLVVGVGDVGQLPPIDATANPWRGDPGYNPYRAWPTAFDDQDSTFSIDLPTVWRPHGSQLGLWRAFYREWDQLDCVAAPEDRYVELPPLSGCVADVWSSVAGGTPTLLEVAGLEDPDAPDIDEPLLRLIEELLDPLLAGGFSVSEQEYEDSGKPKQLRTTRSTEPAGDPLIAILASRNAAVDQALELVEVLTERHGLAEGVVTASTVDKWQGQTNRITIGIHPLSGADELDDFNSAFGRLAVTCTRATHGLLLVTRQGIERLLADAPARPGTPLGEPGVRSLPRQTHQRILGAFARGVLTVD